MNIAPVIDPALDDALPWGEGFFHLKMRILIFKNRPPTGANCGYTLMESAIGCRVGVIEAAIGSSHRQCLLKIVIGPGLAKSGNHINGINLECDGENCSPECDLQRMVPHTF